MDGYDPIAETDQHFQQLTESRLPTPTADSPLRAAIGQTRAMGSAAGYGGQVQTTGGDLVDQAIASRQNFEAQRSNLINQLPYANRRQAAGIAANLHAIDQSQHSLEWEANQRREMAHQSAEEAARQIKIDRATDIDEHGANLINTLGYLGARLRNGEISKPQYDEGLLEAGQRFPLAFHNPEASRLYNFHLNEADKQNQFTSRRDASQAAKIAGRYGIDVQTDPETGLASIPLTQQAALQTNRGKSEQIQQMNQEMRQKYGIGTGVSSLFNPVAPHTDAEGDKINLPYLNSKTGEVANLPVPKPLFNQMKADFQDRYFNIVPQNQPTQQAPANAPAAAPQVPQIASQSDYDALAPGSTFIHNGKQYQKPQPQAQSQ